MKVRKCIIRTDTFYCNLVNNNLNEFPVSIARVKFR
jgi:hypothetical protein